MKKCDICDREMSTITPNTVCDRCAVFTEPAAPRPQPQQKQEMGQCLNCPAEDVPLYDGLCIRCQREVDREISERAERGDL